MTLDGVERVLDRPSTGVDLRRRTTRRSASPGSWAARDRDRSDTTHRAARDGVVRRRSAIAAHGRRASGCAARHRCGSSGAATPRHRPSASPASSSCFGARAPMPVCTWMVDAVGVLPTRVRRRGAHRRVNALLGTELDDAATIRICLDPIGFDDGVRRRWCARTSSCRRGGPTRRARSTSSRRSRATTATPTSRRTVPQVRRAGRLTPHQRDRRLVRQVLVGARLHRGHAERRSSRPATSSGPGSHGRPHVTNPLVADESVLRTSLLPGTAEGDRVQRVAPPARRCACSRSATSTEARRRAPLPDERESSASRWRARPARRRGGARRTDRGTRDRRAAAHPDGTPRAPPEPDGGRQCRWR